MSAVKRLLSRKFNVGGHQLDGWIILANFSTTMNFLCGAIVVFFFVFTIPIERHWVVRLIVFGASWDAIDGRFARKSSFKSRYGSLLDTYADLVTFGLAPTLLIVDLLKDYTPVAAVVAGLLYVYSASFRLSRFMIGGSGKSFSGMPTPVAAIYVSALYILYYLDPIFLSASLLLISLIMMSSFSYTAMKKIDNLFDLVHFVFGIVLMLLFTYAPTSWFEWIAIVFVTYIDYFIIFGPLHAKARKLD